MLSKEKSILITGSNGFIAKNLIFALQEAGFKKLLLVDRNTSNEEFEAKVLQSDYIYHLAGVNRPINDGQYYEGNAGLTKKIIDILSENKKKTTIIFSSSIQAEQDNPYGKSKTAAEELLKQYENLTGGRIYIYRIPNVFGKWCKENYNSFIATFCYNSVNGIESRIDNPQATVELIYIDDLVAEFIDCVKTDNKTSGNLKLSPVYKLSVGEVADLIASFRDKRTKVTIDEVGTGFKRALYATWLTYLRPEDFSYKIEAHKDERGVFGEVLKTGKNGQFSFFTAGIGVTRGGHYHHTKNEKFLVLKGTARFRFQHIHTGQRYEKVVDSKEYEIVDTVPGWSHDITNIGNEELIVMLWANEVFDRNFPDTFTSNIE
ncbi:TPA: NAD-dependent epimerase/dehydratase family protein [Citrobacter sedlakii]